jgi:hypothetical protein
VQRPGLTARKTDFRGKSNLDRVARTHKVMIKSELPNVGASVPARAHAGEINEA